MAVGRDTDKETRAVFPFLFSAAALAESVVSLSFKWHRIIPGISIAERREWDAWPPMTNAAAELRSHSDGAAGTWDG